MKKSMGSKGGKTETAGFNPTMWAKSPTKSNQSKTTGGMMKSGKMKGKGKCPTCM